MLQDKRRLFSLLGLISWGDLGPFTLYKSKRGKIVVFAKTYPGKPPSAKQTVQRDKFKAAVVKWHSLNRDKRERWELATHRISLPLTGLNLFVHHRLEPDESYVRTIERQTGLELID